MQLPQRLGTDLASELVVSWLPAMTSVSTTSVLVDALAPPLSKKVDSLVGACWTKHGRWVKSKGNVGVE